MTAKIMPQNLRIHIVPLGYDFTRATEPLIKMKADKVYFIKHVIDKGHSKFLTQIKKELKRKLPQIEINEKKSDTWNLYECIEEYRKIIHVESGNQVSINLSTGTKITAIAGMLSCMIFDASPYYVRLSDPPEKNEIIREGVKDPQPLPEYKLKKPDPNSMKILKMLQSHGKVMRKTFLIKDLVTAEIIKKKGKNDLSDQAKHNQLRRLLYPLEKQWGFVRIESSPRNSEVILTEQGEKAIQIFGIE